MAAQGDPEAFAALLAPRRTRLLQLLVAILGDWHEAEDALQEASLRAFGQLRNLRDLDALDGWLRALTLNVARDYLRAAAARIRREGQPWGDTRDCPLRLARIPADDPEAACTQLEACRRIWEAIAELPVLQRRAASLAWAVGLQPREIAATLGLSVGSVHAALHRARRRLIRWLESEEVTTEERGRLAVSQAVAGRVRLAGWRYRVGPLQQYWRAARPALQVQIVEPEAQADVEVRSFLEESPAEVLRQSDAMLPLDTLAEGAALDLEPFGHRLLRFCREGRPVWFPWQMASTVVVYNADLLRRVGLSLPPPEWTWEDFLTYCQRCAHAGVVPLPDRRMLGGDLVPYVAEQLGAAPERLAPLRDALLLVQEWWQRARAWAPLRDDAWEHDFYAGNSVFALGQFSNNPYWGFHNPENHPRRFTWGVVPMPRLHRSDAPLPYWERIAVGIRTDTVDPIAAFAVVQAVFTDGPAPRGGELPAYRNSAAMRAWEADPLPLGKECLLELDAATGALDVRARLYGLPGIREVCRSAVEQEITAEEALQRLAADLAIRGAG